MVRSDFWDIQNGKSAILKKTLTKKWRVILTMFKPTAGRLQLDINSFLVNIYTDRYVGNEGIYSQFWPFRISGGQRRMAVLDRTPVYTGSAKGSWDRCKRVQLYYQLITACQYNFNHIYMLFGN